MARVAVVTGAASGLGRRIAHAFAAAGYRVVVTDIDGRGAAVAARELAAVTGALGLEHDIRVKASWDEVLRRSNQEFGGPMVLVNCAGQTLFGDALEVSPRDFSAGIELNLTGTFIGCQVFGRFFAEQATGRIINIASLAGQNGGTASGIHYAAAKAGVLALTKVFARELAARGVTVNAIAPGPLNVAAVRDALSTGQLAGLERGIPVGTLLSPDFVAQTAVLLASDEAISTTGACWDINGGLLLR
ncbi:SDR family oxidoreductase [Leucobacter luti]|nr:SDR family oxidoreductase [Leucobacter luti]